MLDGSQTERLRIASCARRHSEYDLEPRGSNGPESPPLVSWPSGSWIRTESRVSS